MTERDQPRAADRGDRIPAPVRIQLAGVTVSADRVQILPVVADQDAAAPDSGLSPLL
ncbi:MAG: hypothetical protein JWN95_811 [Frankiales bacterium]|nr:hypothetical protein [Frankiales bacterium]